MEGHRHQRMGARSHSNPNPVGGECLGSISLASGRDHVRSPRPASPGHEPGWRGSDATRQGALRDHPRADHRRGPQRCRIMGRRRGAGGARGTRVDRPAAAGRGRASGAERRRRRRGSRQNARRWAAWRCGRPAAAEQLIAEMETARQPILDGIDILSGNDIARVTYSS